MRRRQLVRWLAAGSVLPALPGLTPAQPRGESTQIIVPFAPGGSGDITARLLGQFLGEKGMPTVVDNKPGANGIIGVEAARAAPADGRTLLVVTTSTHAANPSLFRKLPYDPERDFSVVGILGSGGNYMLVRPDAPYRTLADFVAAARARPGSVNYGHFNASSNVPGALLAAQAGIDMVPVPYKQIGTAITDLIAGQIQVLFVDTTAGDAYVSGGQLRALGVTQARRMARHPELPALAETYPGFEVTGFLGIAVRSATPEPLKQSWNRLVNEATESPAMRARLESFGFSSPSLSLAACAAFARAERQRWQGYIAAAKIEPT